MLWRRNAPGFNQRAMEQAFLPEYGNPEARLFGAAPRVLITADVYRVMLLFVEIAPVEVGWQGTVTRRGNDFLIEKVFLLKQDVSAATTDLTVAGRTELLLELELQGATGLEAISNLRFWGHSHVRFPVQASYVDEATAEQFAGDGLPWLVRGIFNKLGCASFSIFLFDQNLCVDNVQWLIVDAEAKAEIRLDGWLTHIRQHYYLGLSPDHYDLAGAYDFLPASLRPDEALRAQIKAEYATKVKERVFPFWTTLWRGSR
jgi:hypothetical protein